MKIGLELSLICGIAFGVEWHPMGSVEDDVGYWVVDIGVVRCLIPYGYPE